MYDVATVSGLVHQDDAPIFNPAYTKLEITKFVLYFPASAAQSGAAVEF